MITIAEYYVIDEAQLKLISRHSDTWLKDYHFYMGVKDLRLAQIDDEQRAALRKLEDALYDYRLGTK